jgi:integrase
MAKRLTAKSIEHLRPGTARREVPDGNGLYHIIQVSGHRSWCVRYRHAGKPVKLTLAADPFSLADARLEAAAAMKALSKGIDPAQARKVQRVQAELAKADTLRAVAEGYFVREEKQKRLRSIGQRRRIFERLIFPTLGGMPIDSIRRTDIIKLIDHVEDNSGPRMADYMTAVLQRLFNWCAIRSETFQSPIPRGLPKRYNTAEHARERTLTDDELRAVWATAEGWDGPFGSFIQFLLLTGCRRNEAAKMVWAEMDGTDWVLPGSRNKVKRDLVRPLSADALAVLAEQPRFTDCTYVFTDGRYPLNSFTPLKKRFDAKCGIENWCLHDLRRTSRSLMSRAGVAPDHAERVLGHLIGGVRGVYDRHAYHAEKKLALEKLAAEIGRILHPTDNVLPMRRR